MATQPIDPPVTPLRQRMLDDMAMRAMRARTQHDYDGGAEGRKGAARCGTPALELAERTEV